MIQLAKKPGFFKQKEKGMALRKATNSDPPTIIYNVIYLVNQSKVQQTAK